MGNLEAVTKCSLSSKRIFRGVSLKIGFRERLGGQRYSKAHASQRVLRGQRKLV